MDDSIEVEILDLSCLTRDNSFVFIHVNVGHMQPDAALEYIEAIRNELNLCKRLEERRIDYAVVARRPDGSNTISLKVELKQDDAGNDIDPIIKFDTAMEII